MLKGGLRKNMRRRLKIVPSILLLVLCLGILGVGIYAAKPASNTISGTVTVTAANARVLIDVYKDKVEEGYEIANQVDTRTGATISLNNMTFVKRNGEDLSKADDTSTVADIPLIFKITNYSTKNLGVYFSDEVIDEPMNEIISGADVATANAKVLTTKTFSSIVTASISAYVSLTGSSSESVSSGTGLSVTYVKMTLRLNSLVESATNVSIFGIYLNVEEVTTGTTNGVTNIVPSTATNLTFTPTNTTNTFEVSACKSATISGAFTVPEFVLVSGNVYTVTSLANNAFKDCASLSSLTLPKSIMRVGTGAFDGCTALQNTDGDLIYIAVSGNSHYALFSATSNTLTDVNVHRDCKFVLIQFGPFRSLREVSLPNGLIGIGDGSFYPQWYDDGGEYKNTLENLSFGLPECLVDIGSHAFAGSYWSGETIVIPGSVKRVGSEAFKDADVELIIFSEGVEVIESGSWFGNFPGRSSVVLPSSVIYEETNLDGYPHGDVTFYINSVYVTRRLNSAEAYLGIGYFGAPVYISTDIAESDIADYFKNNFTKADTSDVAGYNKYLKNS